ncbi:MAG: nuclear transport factor 2 family protein [Acidobacteria bacterium]|nr:nuclear transport factor 2 family protein [Acidobacteriota bacterium]
MKRILFITLLVCVAALPAFAQTSAKPALSKDAQAVLKRLDEVLTALVKRDGALIERVFTDDYFTVYDGGGVGDRARLVNSLKSETSGWDDWQQVERQANVHGDTAIVLCRYKVKAHNSRGSYEADWRSTSVWLKERGQWRLAASQFTAIKPAGPPATQ